MMTTLNRLLSLQLTTLPTVWKIELAGLNIQLTYPNFNCLIIVAGDATVAGWGTEDEVYQEVSPVLRKVTIPLVQSIDCARQYGGYFLPLKMICAGEEEGGKG